MQRGVLLINLGTPDSPKTRDVRRFLREFLADKRVIRLPAFLRYILLFGVILPFRSKRSAQAYRMIWTEKGSPLAIYSLQLQQQLQTKLGEGYRVALGMRYGTPTLNAALTELNGCSHITILPLYPQHSSAASASSLEKALQIVSRWNTIPSLHIISEFHQHSAFLKAQAALILPYLDDHDFILFSYHGVPEQHIVESGCKTICKDSCPPSDQMSHSCYRSQCFQTTRELATLLSLTHSQFATSFQSRLGRTAWIAPYTDEYLIHLSKTSVRRLLICCPAFVADCLETLEEIAIRAEHQWKSLGGESLTLVPSLNADPRWIEALQCIITETSQDHTLESQYR